MKRTNFLNINIGSTIRILYVFPVDIYIYILQIKYIYFIDKIFCVYIYIYNLSDGEDLEKEESIPG